MKSYAPIKIIITQLIIKHCQNKYNKSNLFDSDISTFLKYRNIKKFSNLSFTSKQKDLKEFKVTMELFYDETKKLR